MKRFQLLMLILLALPTMAQFGSPIEIATDVSSSFHARIEAVDMDADGALDLVFLRESDLVWVRNMDGAGNFGPVNVLHTPASLFAVGDIDADGDPDVVFVEPTGEVAWMSNTDGLGSFGAAQSVGTLDQAQAMLCTDLNGDGLPDFAFIADDQGDAIVEVRINSGGTFMGPESVTCGVGGMGLRLLHGDMDLDGRLDLVALDGDGVLRVLVNDGAAIPGWTTTVAGNTLPEAKLQLIDVDDDGDLDMIFSSGGLMQWGENTSSAGNVIPLTIHEIGTETNHFAHAARLGCGPEVALVHYQGLGGQLFWKLFDPVSSTFITPVPSILIYSVIPGLTTTADLNGDGRLDILHAAPTGQLSWYTNDLPIATTEIVLQPFDTLCATGTSYPLDGLASPSGGTWSGPGVVDNVFTPFESGSFSLTYSIPCPPSASQTITVINSPTITLVSGDPTDLCALDPLVYSASPAGGVWSGLASSDGSVARDCSVRPTSGMAIYTYTAQNGECSTLAGFSDLLLSCASINLGTDVTLCTSSDTLEVFVQGPFAGAASVSGCDHTELTSPSTVTGYFIPGNHQPGDYLIIGHVNGSGYCEGTDTLVVTLIASPDAGFDSTLSVCADAEPFSLISVLGGTPQADGTWSLGGAPHSGTFIPDVDTAGVYTYEVDANGPCASNSATVTISVTPPPFASIIYLDSPYCDSVGVANVTQTGTTDGTYTSSPEGLALDPTTGTVSLDSSTLGTYTVLYTIAPDGGCARFQTSTSITIDCSTSIGRYPMSNPQWLTIQPNPSNGSFELVPSGSNAGPISVSIYDALGQLIMRPVQFNGDQPQLLRLDDKYADGIYFLHLARGDENYIMQLMIQR